MSHSCTICEAPIRGDVAHLSLSDRRRGIPGKWDIFECGGCGLLSRLPIPSQAELEGYYSAYHDQAPLILQKPRRSRSRQLRTLYHRLSGDVDPRDFVKVPSGARVLDYGCGNAAYLADYHHDGVRISGADASENAVRRCVKHHLDVRLVDPHDRIPFEDHAFQVVYSMQVLEHLADPVAFFREVARVLTPKGMVYLSVPNKKSVWRKVFRKNWVSGWFPPFHLFHYDRDLLRSVAARHSFELVESWSSTPEPWLRLNLKAVFYPSENCLDRRTCWLDLRPVRFALMLALRLVELAVRERDCLVLVFRKVS
jgi:SAM-dependent methyltransferase